MSKAIIGYTGFVGSNLINQSQYDDFYNSKNIENIKGKNFDLLVCSGAYAAKWIANKEPIKDKENIEYLISCLKEITARKFILISTVDVYKKPIKVNEDTPIFLEDLHPYGKHRRELEIFVENNFDALIIRLPGLFGTGLKKNIIYDFIHNNMIDKICPDSVFQFYNLDRIWKDIQTALNHNLKLINFACEPISVQEVVAQAFDFEFINSSENKPVYYNMQTKYAHLFEENQSKYIYDKQQLLEELKDFVNKNKT